MSTFVGTSLSDRFDRGLAYALDVHRNDTRKSTGIPYLSHLFAVCALVWENDGTENEAIAALLHDAAEDHGGLDRLHDIERHFGAEVAGIVEGCSDSLVDTTRERKPPWANRKQAFVARIAGLEDDARAGSILLVCAADKLHNLRTIAADLERPEVGERVFSRMAGRKPGTLWYYRRLSEVFAAHPGRHAPCARELSTLGIRLADGRSTDDLWRAYERGE